MINRKGQYISLLVEDFATLLISRSARGFGQKI